jgi:phosphogluconate dehydratase
MPELHKLIPALGLLARGRCRHRHRRPYAGLRQGAAAIHLTPEAAADGPISKLRDGDIIRLDARAGVLEAQTRPRCGA